MSNILKNSDQTALLVIDIVNSCCHEKCEDPEFGITFNKIRKMVNDEVEKYTKATIGDVATKVGMSDFDLVEFIMNLYEKLIISKINEVLVTINISDIIKSRIDEMDMVELEGLILMIMKKELNALVSLGAIIGFVLGLVNLLF